MFFFHTSISEHVTNPQNSRWKVDPVVRFYYLNAEPSGVTNSLGGGAPLRTILQMVRGAERFVRARYLGLFIEGYYPLARHHESTS